MRRASERAVLMLRSLVSLWATVNPVTVYAAMSSAVCANGPPDHAPGYR